MCYAFVITATMYGEEVANKNASCLGAVQEFMDYIHRFKRPRLVTDSGSFDVPLKGFTCNFVNSFGYVKKRGLSPEALYPWVGHPSSSRYEPPNGDWDGLVMVGEHQVKDHEKIWIKNFVRLKTHDDVERMLHKQPVASSVLLT
ncbi:hypothetical protein SASPL_152768 [Salvia splendens]|uniref:Uncharacterized protein n=1 Tax=Salvia splendens TaxID=180675 RepID=A0A8X8W3W3_SALSN|nr:hypothetical protein SASPL_152768 [Salvia splendens]